MSAGLAVKTRHALIGGAALSLAGAAWSVFHVWPSGDSHVISMDRSVSVIRSPASGAAIPLNDYAGRLFAQSGKQDRADYAARATAALDAPGDGNAKQRIAPDKRSEPSIMAASFTPVDMIRGGPTRFAGELRQDVNRTSKADRLDATGQAAPASKPVTDDELRGPGISAAMFMLSSNRGWSEEASDAEGETASAGQTAGGWSDLIELARVDGGDGEKIEAGIFGALSEREFRAREFRCMATAVYFEARGESIEGQIAVGQVIMTRVRSDYYPNTICGVVFQGQWNRNACQFSFACDGKPDTPKDRKRWDIAIDVAKKVISGQAYIKEIGEATHYHATYVSPDWRKQMERVKQIGVHIFYKAPFVRPLVASTEFDDL